MLLAADMMARNSIPQLLLLLSLLILSLVVQLLLFNVFIENCRNNQDIWSILQRIKTDDFDSKFEMKHGYVLTFC